MGFIGFHITGYNQGGKYIEGYFDKTVIATPIKILLASQGPPLQPSSTPPLTGLLIPGKFPGGADSPAPASQAAGKFPAFDGPVFSVKQAPVLTNCHQPNFSFPVAPPQKDIFTSPWEIVPPRGGRSAATARSANGRYTEKRPQYGASRRKIEKIADFSLASFFDSRNYILSWILV